MLDHDSSGVKIDVLVCRGALERSDCDEHDPRFGVTP